MCWKEKRSLLWDMMRIKFWFGNTSLYKSMIFDRKGYLSLLRRECCNLSYKITDQHLEASSASTFHYSNQEVGSDHSVWWLEAFYMQWNYIHSYFIRFGGFVYFSLFFPCCSLLFYRQHFCPLTMIISFRLKPSSLDSERFFFYSAFILAYLYFLHLLMSINHILILIGQDWPTLCIQLQMRFH